MNSYYQIRILVCATQATDILRAFILQGMTYLQNLSRCVVLRNLGRQQASKILLAQLSISLIVALIYGVLQGGVAAYSALWGGLVCVIANFFFFRHAFKVSGAQAAQQMMRGFMFGQMGKFVITVVLFALAFTVGQVQPLALFIGYVCAQAALWLAPVFLKQRVYVNE